MSWSHDESPETRREEETSAYFKCQMVLRLRCEGAWISWLRCENACLWEQWMDTKQQALYPSSAVGKPGTKPCMGYQAMGWWRVPLKAFYCQGSFMRIPDTRKPLEVLKSIACEAAWFIGPLFSSCFGRQQQVWTSNFKSHTYCTLYMYCILCSIVFYKVVWCRLFCLSCFQIVCSRLRDVLWLQSNAKALTFEAELLGLVEWDWQWPQKRRRSTEVTCTLNDIACQAKKH